MSSAASFRVRSALLRLAWAGTSLAIVLSLGGCKPKAAETSNGALPGRGEDEPAHGGTVVNAAWCDVPLFSLAKRRAGVEEMTAAHNRLPLGTRVRVTHLANGKSVTVRITDRGIHDRKVKLDLCKEAATELEMVGKGIARVRMEILPGEQDQDGAASPGSEPIAAQQ